MRSRNHCYCDTTIRAKYDDCVVCRHAVIILHETHIFSVPYYTVICVVRLLLPCFATLFRSGHNLRGKNVYWTQDVCFDFQYNFCLKHFSFWEELNEISQMQTDAGLRIITRYSCQILIKFDFRKYSKLKFKEIQFSGRRIVRCGRTDGRTEGQTDRQTWEVNSSFLQFCESA